MKRNDLIIARKSSLPSRVVVPAYLLEHLRLEWLWPIPIRFSMLMLLAMLVVLASACSHVQFVAEYDAKTLEETIRIGKEVDIFYGRLVELPPAQRTYSQFAMQYVDMAADINSLYQRNVARPLNTESQRITQDILKFWQQYQQKHKTNNAYPDARLDKLRFNRLFTAAISAEAAKKVSSTDDGINAASDPP